MIPITLVIYGLLRRWQERHVFRRLGCPPQARRRGFIGYLFAYQALPRRRRCAATGSTHRAGTPLEVDTRPPPGRNATPRDLPNGEGRNRTGDTTVFSRVLYQLSYLAAR